MNSTSDTSQPHSSVGDAGEPKTARGRLRSPGAMLGKVRDYGVIGFLAVIFIVLSLSTYTFFTVQNLTNVLDASVVVGLLAISGGFVIIAGGFDLSSGSVLAVGAVVCAQNVDSRGPVVAVLLALLVGAGLGLINGLLCTVGGLNAFVGTLGTSIAFQGLAVAISGGSAQSISNEGFDNWATTHIFGLSSAVWIFALTAAAYAVLLNKTVFGRHVRGTGGNPEAARLSGVPVNRTLAVTFVLSGVSAALAGTIIASRSGVVSPNVGSTIVFDALAAILIGGNSIFGGIGSIWRVLVGVGILVLIANGFNLLGIDHTYQQAATGVLIVFAIGADAWTRRKV